MTTMTRMLIVVLAALALALTPALAEEAEDEAQDREVEEMEAEENDEAAEDEPEEPEVATRLYNLHVYGLPMGEGRAMDKLGPVGRLDGVEVMRVDLEGSAVVVRVREDAVVDIHAFRSALGEAGLRYRFMTER